MLFSTQKAIPNAGDYNQRLWLLEMVMLLVSNNIVMQTFDQYVYNKRAFNTTRGDSL